MILLIESTKPFSPTIGGSFKSLKVLVECFEAENLDHCVSFYFKNPIADSLVKRGTRVFYPKYISPLRFLRKISPDGHARSRREKEAIALGSQTQKRSRPKKAGYLKEFYQIFLALLNSIPLMYIILRNNITLVYCNTGVTIDRSAIVAGFVTRRKVISHLRNLPGLTSFDRFLVQRLDATVSISNAVSNHYKGLEVTLPDSSYILPNALGRDFEKQKKEIGKLVFAEGDEFVIGCFCRLIEWKGVLDLVDGYSCYRNSGGKGKLRFIGNGPLVPEVTERAKELGLGSLVSVDGYVDDVAEVMRECSVIVCPSIEAEPLGRVVMEAMRVGVPVIASDSGGHLETIEDGVSGLLFRTGDTADLATKLQAVYSNIEQRVELAQMGLSTSEKWGTNEYCTKLSSIINETLDR